MTNDAGFHQEGRLIEGVDQLTGEFPLRVGDYPRQEFLRLDEVLRLESEYPHLGEEYPHRGGEFPRLGDGFPRQAGEFPRRRDEFRQMAEELCLLEEESHHQVDGRCLPEGEDPLVSCFTLLSHFFLLSWNLLRRFFSRSNST